MAEEATINRTDEVEESEEESTSSGSTSNNEEAEETDGVRLRAGRAVPGSPERVRPRPRSAFRIPKGGAGDSQSQDESSQSSSSERGRDGGRGDAFPAPGTLPAPSLQHLPVGQKALIIAKRVLPAFILIFAVIYYSIKPDPQKLEAQQIFEEDLADTWATRLTMQPRRLRVKITEDARAMGRGGMPLVFVSDDIDTAECSAYLFTILIAGPGGGSKRQLSRRIQIGKIIQTLANASFDGDFDRAKKMFHEDPSHERLVVEKVQSAIGKGKWFIISDIHHLTPATVRALNQNYGSRPKGKGLIMIGLARRKELPEIRPFTPLGKKRVGSQCGRFFNDSLWRKWSDYDKTLPLYVQKLKGEDL